MREVWEDIKDYEDLYQISNYGRVKSLRHPWEMILKPGVRKNWLFVCKFM